MKNIVLVGLGFSLSFLLGFTLKSNDKQQDETESIRSKKLGAFSISLSVKDLSTSRDFYEKLGFIVHGGALESNYLIMKSENALVGLFQGMFEGNILTFNPGWDENGESISEFDDIRAIQKRLKDHGIKLDVEIDAEAEGPASFVLSDPDGNVILFDQHR